jgi:hypothetical protein
MSEDLKEVMAKLEELTKLITKKDTPMIPIADVPDNQACGDVCYTRLYKTDEALMDEVCKKSGRKKAAVIRILVSDGLRRGLIDD